MRDIPVFLYGQIRFFKFTFESGFSRPSDLVVSHWSDPCGLHPDPQPRAQLHFMGTELQFLAQLDKAIFHPRAAAAAKVLYRNAQNIVHMFGPIVNPLKFPFRKLNS